MLNYLQRLRAKLQTLKECQKMFDEFIERLTDRLRTRGSKKLISSDYVWDKIDKLSKEVLGLNK